MLYPVENTEDLVLVVDGLLFDPLDSRFKLLDGLEDSIPENVRSRHLQGGDVYQIENAGSRG